MGAAYVTALEVAEVLDVTEMTRLAADAAAGATQLSVVGPVDVPPGALLAVGYRGLGAELVRVASV
ncbi:MAG TPA: hypothetical protein VIK91_12240, partial [Nannocystis sp.]